MSDFATQCLERHLLTRRNMIQSVANDLTDLCKSPIELRFGLALLTTDLSALTWVAIWGDEPPRRETHGLFIIPQLRVGNYRGDFGLVCRGEGGEARIVAECDGHEFHEKTKEQAAHDKARDRAFLEAGWPVMRFTGSEIHRDPTACANQAIDYLIRLILQKREAA